LKYACYNTATSVWKNFCNTTLQIVFATQSPQQQPEPQTKPVSETPESYQLHPKRTLFDISTDLEKLNDLLDDCGDDA
jgi:hypothetical protein